MKRLVVGLLAHVDSGKTTLAEGLLYRAGVLRKLGRVDHRDAFLDTDSQERARGITIFAKQAVLTLPAADGADETELTLLDTPGHVDFSAEAERALQVLDYAVLVVSGTDGVQAHTETLWKLLARYRVPTFVFVNKMDLPGADAAVDKALRLDSTVMLVDDPVKRVDNMTMAWGLEARTPFLDYRLVELSARVPGQYKLPDGGKQVLKEAARRVIPSEVIDRKKGYFPVPGLKHLQGDTLNWVRELLLDPSQDRGLFKPAMLDRLLTDPQGQLTPLGGSKLWQLAALNLWLSEQGI